MKPKNIYWKVVHVNGNNKLVSCIAWYTRYSLTYELNKITYPEVGKIFVFRTRAQARDFKGKNPDLGLTRKIL
jgi:hypothetical protein